jgi:hypothetical protein
MRNRRHREDVVLVTTARDSLLVEQEARRRRYLWSMAVRVACFLLAVTLLHGIAQVIAIGASLVIPWVAVVAANGGPPRDVRRMSYADREPHQALETPARELSAPRPPVDI